ncbi:EF-hand domain-containing protein [Aestuariivirga sp.]|uniref:EF-hand domain-containing protein n=1 Tax=Aestuariivirga sp. TaxID=2650926 RepID=UPI00359406F5
MKHIIRAAAVAAMLVASVGVALADDNNSWGWGWGHGSGRGGMMGNPGFMGRMATIDNDGDGMISDDEAAAQVEAVFLAMDSDDDGELTEEEYMTVRMGSGEGRNPSRKAQMQERKKARFTEMDTGKNGKVSKAEFIGGGKARFEAADTDKDGKVTPWEFRAQHWR